MPLIKWNGGFFVAADILDPDTLAIRRILNG